MPASLDELKSSIENATTEIDDDEKLSMENQKINSENEKEIIVAESTVAFVDAGDDVDGVENGLTNNGSTIEHVSENDSGDGNTKIENQNQNRNAKFEENQTVANGIAVETGSTEGATDEGKFWKIRKLSAKMAPRINNVTAKPSEMNHQVKWIQWSAGGSSGIGTMTPIVTQNENGPCPLLALINVLFLRGQARLEPEVKEVSSQKLLDILHDCIVRMTPQELMAHKADYQRNMDDALVSLPKLLTGIDVNVRFTSVDQFEYTPDCLVFDLLNIPLYHGWLVEPDRGPVADAVGQFSYNQLIEFIIGAKSGDEQNIVSASLAEDFLETTAGQLTNQGLYELNATLKDGALCVFFRNNHFSTLLKHEDELFLLVTDQGFLNEPRVVWESLNSVDGDSRFVDMEFRTAPPKPVPVPTVEGAASLPADASPQEQLDHDLMVALSLEEQERAAIDGEEIADATSAASDVETSLEERDRRLALKLQEEEDKLAAQEQRQGTPVGGGGGGSASMTSSQQRHSPDSASSSTSGRRSSDRKRPGGDLGNEDFPTKVSGVGQLRVSLDEALKRWRYHGGRLCGGAYYGGDFSKYPHLKKFYHQNLGNTEAARDTINSFRRAITKNGKLAEKVTCYFLIYSHFELAADVVAYRDTDGNWGEFRFTEDFVGVKFGDSICKNAVECVHISYENSQPIHGHLVLLTGVEDRHQSVDAPADQKPSHGGGTSQGEGKSKSVSTTGTGGDN